MTALPSPSHDALQWFVSAITKAEALSGNAEALANPSDYMVRKLEQYSASEQVVEGIEKLHAELKARGELDEGLWAKRIKQKAVERAA